MSEQSIVQLRGEKTRLLDENERLMEAMRAKCEAIARERMFYDPECWTIVRDIAALKTDGLGEL